MECRCRGTGLLCWQRRRFRCARKDDVADGLDVLRFVVEEIEGPELWWRAEADRDDLAFGAFTMALRDVELIPRDKRVTERGSDVQTIGGGVKCVDRMDEGVHNTSQ